MNQESMGTEPKEPRTYPARPINCDQVSWVLGAIKRYLPPANAPAVSRAREMQAYALLYEIMEVAHLHFQDDAAQHNGTPPDVRRFRYASKRDESQYESGKLTQEPGQPSAARAQGEGGAILGDTNWGGETLRY